MVSLLAPLLSWVSADGEWFRHTLVLGLLSSASAGLGVKPSWHGKELS